MFGYKNIQSVNNNAILSHFNWILHYILVSSESAINSRLGPSVCRTRDTNYVLTFFAPKEVCAHGHKNIIYISVKL